MGRQVRPKLTHIVIGMTYLILLVPAYRIFPFDARISDLVYHIIYSRYLFSTILLLSISAMLIRINWSDMPYSNENIKP